MGSSTAHEFEHAQACGVSSSPSLSLDWPQRSFHPMQLMLGKHQPPNTATIPKIQLATSATRDVLPRTSKTKASNSLASAIHIFSTKLLPPRRFSSALMASPTWSTAPLPSIRSPSPTKHWARTLWSLLLRPLLQPPTCTRLSLPLATTALKLPSLEAPGPHSGRLTHGSTAHQTDLSGRLVHATTPSGTRLIQPLTTTMATLPQRTLHTRLCPSTSTASRLPLQHQHQSQTRLRQYPSHSTSVTLPASSMLSELMATTRANASRSPLVVASRSRTSGKKMAGSTPPTRCGRMASVTVPHSLLCLA